MNAPDGNPPLPKPATAVVSAEKSDRNFSVTLLLCIFLGCFGVHRFYAGRIGTGVLQLLTLGGLGIWAFIDIFIIATGSFKDGQGKPIKA